LNIIKAYNLSCPIDGEVLSLLNKQLVCSNGHAFDIAKQGHVNLLPVQHKRSKEPGDSKEMVVARTLFLNTGLYQPIAKKLTEISYALMTDNNIDNFNPDNVCLFDAGCGEGYYFDYLFNVFTNKQSSHYCASFIGLDISKYAIIAASKRNKQITWLVGTNRQPPVCDNSVDIIICVFGFHSFEGFFKILKPGGYIILVEPGPDHLTELREIIYSDVKKTDPPDLASAEQLGFAPVSNQTLQFKTGDINNEIIQNLLLMTPHFFRANKAGRDAATRLHSINLSVDVEFRVLKKH